MNLGTNARVARVAEIGLMAAASYFAAAYLIVALRRLTYPFELQWMEGQSLIQIARLLQGEPLYVRPSFDYVPMIYQPLYFYVAAVVAKVVGAGFVPLRLVSFGASLGCAVIIFLFVRRETQRATAGVMAAGLWLATFHSSGAWFDIGRVDTLAVMWLLVALYLARGRTTAAWAGSGVALALAYLTKQTAIIVAVPMGLYAVWSDRRRSVALIAAVLSVIGGSFLFLNFVHAGWYAFYILDLPQQHALTISLEKMASFWVLDIGLALPIASVMAIQMLGLRRFVGFELKTAGFYWAATAGLFAMSFVGRLNLGGFLNNLMPAYAMLSICFGLAINHWRAQPITTRRSALAAVGISALSALQFALLIYPIEAQIPESQEMAAGQQLVERIRQLPGEVYIPYHPYLAMLAGKSGLAHQVAWAELQGDFGGQASALLQVVQSEFRQAVRTKELAAVMLDVPGWLEADLAPYYSPQATPVFAASDVFWPVTDWRIRPTIVFLPDP